MLQVCMGASVQKAHVWETCSPADGAVLEGCRIFNRWIFAGGSGPLQGKPRGFITPPHVLSVLVLLTADSMNVSGCLWVLVDYALEP